MNLQWKSYGDSGRTAKGDQGRWRIVTCGKWWHMTLQPASSEEQLNVGKFVDRSRAMEFAQEREDGVEIVPAAAGELQEGREQ